MRAAFGRQGARPDSQSFFKAFASFLMENKTSPKFYKQRAMKTVLHVLILFSLASVISCTRKISGVNSTSTNNIASNKAVASKYLEEIINHQRVDLVKEVFTDDVQVINGKESGHLKRMETFLSTFYKAFPDINYTVDDIVAEGDKVVIRATVKATHKGEFWGYQPLGNKLDIREIFFFTMENGKVKSHSGYPDMFKLDKQLKATQ